MAASPFTELREQMYGEDADRPRGVFHARTATRRITLPAAAVLAVEGLHAAGGVAGSAAGASTGLVDGILLDAAGAKGAGWIWSTPWPSRCRSP